MSIKVRLTLLINMVVIPLIVVLSILFYEQFREALNERVLLQLTSIKRLKRTQIEDYLHHKWQDAVNLAANDETYRNKDRDKIHHFNSLTTLPFDWQWGPIKPNTMKDVSHLDKTGRLTVAISVSNDTTNLVMISHLPKVSKILMERTGMGKTGETYIVGSDYHLRSKSRFMPKIKPTDILAETESVKSGLSGHRGHRITEDYRNVEVYSAYHPIKYKGINWVILSEIDVEEALAPLSKLRMRLLFIGIAVFIITFILSVLVARNFLKPISDMRSILSKMAKGDFNMEMKTPNNGSEIQEMFEALTRLIAAIKSTMRFAVDIGNMKLDTTYHKLSEYDTLGESLILMRDKLRDFNKKEKELETESKKALLTGQENERTRLSRELHDGLGPLLTSLKLTIDKTEIEPEVKKRLKTFVDDTVSEVRRMTYNLMPQALLDFGVGNALSKLFDTIKTISSIDIKYQNFLRSPSNIKDKNIHITLYRIVQEAVNNAIKHSDASEIIISITEFDDKVSLFIKDDGSGFDFNNVKYGSGLLNMKERCRILNGFFHIETDSNGTSIEAEIPISND